MPLSIGTFDLVRGMVRDGAALVIEPGKEYLVEARLESVAKRAGYGSVDEYVGAVAAARPELAEPLVEAMTINETSFFRDAAVFEALRLKIVPALIEARRSVRKLRIWSAATSSGQEAYSLLFLLDDHFPETVDWTIELLGTDLSTEMLRRAREGAYSHFEVARGLPAAMLTKHCVRRGLDWQVKEEHRRRVRFERMNLARPWPDAPAWDLILLRNVLIYMDADARSAMLRKAWAAMASDGALVLGCAETATTEECGFAREETAKAAWFRPKAD